MRVWFVGPGGTRHFIARQPAGFGTGGFYVELEGNNFYVDPGPGAMVRGVRMGIKWEDIKNIVATHAHLDHIGDLEALIEAVTKTQRKVRLITTTTVMERISSYHKGFVNWLDWKELSYAYPTDHGTEGFGMLWEEEKRLLYTSDTKYKQGMFPEADVVIGNVVVFRDSQSGKHLSVEAFAQLIQDVGAKVAIVSHLSPILVYRLGELKEYLERETDAKVVVAREGLLYDI